MSNHLISGPDRGILAECIRIVEVTGGAKSMQYAATINALASRLEEVDTLEEQARKEARRGVEASIADAVQDERDRVAEHLTEVASGLDAEETVDVGEVLLKLAEQVRGGKLEEVTAGAS